MTTAQDDVPQGAKIVKVYYTLDDVPFDDLYFVEETFGFLEKDAWLNAVARDVARDYYVNHDGWESNWDDGLMFTLWRTDRTEVPEKIGQFNIFVEMRPSFTALEIKGQTDPIGAPS